jgi:hypothetical protein
MCGEAGSRRAIRKAQEENQHCYDLGIIKGKEKKDMKDRRKI